MEINIHLKTSDYNIIIEEGVLNKVNQYTDLYRKVLIVTDDGIPEEWITPVEAKCKEAYRFTIKAGEESKTLTSFQEILRFMLEKDFTRTDCVVAIGGGVVGDLAGFVAASFMRGIDFYNIPTTLLSQIDSSIGGKTGVNLDHVKNIVGAFYQPKGVLIDPATLRTLDERQIRSGMAEAIKIAAVFDADFFKYLEERDLNEPFENIIQPCLHLKRMVVEQDEKEKGLRKTLNFGHTVGHAIEVNSNLTHGESVAVGMTYFIHPDLRPRLLKVLEKYNLPTQTNLPVDVLMGTLRHDKKAEGANVTIVKVEKLGQFKLEKVSLEEIESYLNNFSLESKNKETL